MRSLNLKYLLFMIFLFVNGCTSSTQMSSYRNAEGGESWSVKVIEKTSIKKWMPEYMCVINDSVVLSETFPATTRSFIKKGKYHGKTVIMNGYKISDKITSSDGTTTYKNFYEIRVLIDGDLVDKFNF